MDDLINKIKQKLNLPLPGEDAQYIMAPVGRKGLRETNLENITVKMSAVMLLICGENKSGLYVPLTERFPYDGAHSGQVSLPGGKFDDDDRTLEFTALRECREEIGISEGVRVLGNLTRLYIPVSNFMVQPVVGYCADAESQLVPNEREVKTIIRLPLKTLLNEDLVKLGEVEVAGSLKRKAPYFEIEGLKVWGATAMILSEFKTLLRTIY